MTRDAAASSSSVVTPGATSSRTASSAAAVIRPGSTSARSCAGALSIPRPNATSGGRPRRDPASLQCFEDPAGDRVDRSDAVDGVDQAPPAVHLEDGRGLALVDRQAVRDDLFGVVGPPL